MLIESAHAIDRGATAAGIVETISLLIEQVLATPAAVRGRNRRHRHRVRRPGRRRTRVDHPFPSHTWLRKFPIASIFEERFGLPTVLENDARAAALGEFTHGAGRGAHDMVYIHLGTGVGGGVILGGVLQHGASMTSGELGHMVVASDGPRCSCGKPGHLEAYASENAIVERMRLRLADARSSRDRHLAR